MGGVSLDRDSLSSMKVSELRLLCKDNGLMISGNKDELISRLLGANEAEKSSKNILDSSNSEQEKDDAIDRLLSRIESGSGTQSIEDEAEDSNEPEEVLEAVVMEAYIVETKTGPPIPEGGIPDGWTIEKWNHYGQQWLDNLSEQLNSVPEDSIILDDESDASIILETDEDEQDAWTGGIISEEKEETLVADEIESAESQASITFTIPSLSSIDFSPKVIGAITIAALILGAIGFTLFLNQDSSFQARNLHYGDSMEFNVLSSSIEIEGDDMVAIFRDFGSGTLDEVCDELTAEIPSGTGSVSIREGDSSEIIHPTDKQYSGAVSALDAFGRTHLAAEKMIYHEMRVDLSGKVLSDGECSGFGWTYLDNSLEMTTKTWTDIGDKEIIRSSTDLTIRDFQNEATNLEATTFGLDAISGLGVLSSYVFLPLTPLDLHDFFGDESLSSGSTSKDGADWYWTVGEERKDNEHGLVYEISISQPDFDACNGHININLLVKSGVPWPVEQTANIVVDKSQGTNECGLIESSLSDATIPDGRITISFSMRAKADGINLGSNPIEWRVDYTSKPGPGEDRPGTSSQRQWNVAMPDESETRKWELESALDCTLANYSSSGVSTAIEQGGYIWRATTMVVSSKVQWNMSWITEDERAGWTVVEEDNGGCSLIDDENMDDGTVQWNRNAIPDTLTMSRLESRLLSSSRYPGLNLHINDGSGGWDDGVEYSYRLSVSEDNEIFDTLPINLGDGVVSVYAEKSWTDNSDRNHDVVCVMDAENARVLGWYHYWTPPN